MADPARKLSEELLFSAPSTRTEEPVHLSLVPEEGSHFCAPSHSTPAHSARFLLPLATLLIALQLLDGVLTAYGVSVFGIESEGNPLLRRLMENFGSLPVLIAAKGLGIAIVCALVFYAAEVRWIEKAMAGVAGLYLIAAVLPWTVLLSTCYLFTA
ncbi:DUF5658 family protein [bacterium]|nr:DUF5658 family protein [bacterium]